VGFTKLFWSAVYQRNRVKGFESNLKEKNENLQNESSKFIYYTRNEYENDDSTAEILGAVMNFGYVIQFGASSPIVFLFMFVQTLFNRMLDAVCMLKLQYVKLISTHIKIFKIILLGESQGIGVFRKVLKIMVYFGLITNMCIIFYTSNKIHFLDSYEKVLYLFLIENAIIILLMISSFADQPFWFQHKEKIEMNYLKKYGNVCEEHYTDPSRTEIYGSKGTM
jgi:hypothetical protein